MTKKAKELSDFVAKKMQQENPELWKTYNSYLSYPQDDDGKIQIIPIDGYISQYDEFVKLIKDAESLFYPSQF